MNNLRHMWRNAAWRENNMIMYLHNGVGIDLNATFAVCLQEEPNPVLAADMLFSIIAQLTNAENPDEIDEESQSNLFDIARRCLRYHRHAAAIVRKSETKRNYHSLHKAVEKEGHWFWSAEERDKWVTDRKKALEEKGKKA